MRCQRPSRICLLALILGMVPVAQLSAQPRDGVVCSGHELLSTPRPESSCFDVKPRIYPSPDGALRAVVLPVNVSLYATPDMESRVVIRTAKGDTQTSMDYSSPRGTNGFYVVNAKWSPDSQFFVYSMSSSGGHSPWSFPIMVYGRKKDLIARFSDMIGGPTLSADFDFSGPHTLVARTWKGAGAIENPIAVTVDLDAAFEKLPSTK